MAAGTSPIQSDLGLLAQVRRYGPFDLSGCYQCGSCTLTCELTTASASFPRKSMRYTLLGLRAPLAAGLEPWICHDCGDCSEQCPRQAEPRQAMATLRRYLHGQYDWTRISRLLLRSRAGYVATLAGTALATALLILLYHLYYVGLMWGDLKTPFGLEHMFPTITWYTRTVVLVPLLLLGSQAARMWWLAMRGNGLRTPLSAYLAEAREWFVHAASQKLLRRCNDPSRWLGHWLLTVGVAAMLVIKVFALPWFQTESVYPLYHPQRWIGYLATGFIVYGVGDILVGRMRARKAFFQARRFEDFALPVLLAGTALSGIAVHLFRYLGFELTCHYLYALHIVIATPMLLVEIPFGAWSHMCFRPLALYLRAVRERAQQQVPAQEAVPHAA